MMGIRGMGSMDVLEELKALKSAPGQVAKDHIKAAVHHFTFSRLGIGNGNKAGVRVPEGFRGHACSVGVGINY